VSAKEDAMFVDWLRMLLGVEPIHRPGLGRRNRDTTKRLHMEVMSSGNRRVGVGGARFPKNMSYWW